MGVRLITMILTQFMCRHRNFNKNNDDKNSSNYVSRNGSINIIRKIY